MIAAPTLVEIPNCSREASLDLDRMLRFRGGELCTPSGCESTDGSSEIIDELPPLIESTSDAATANDGRQGSWTSVDSLDSLEEGLEGLESHEVEDLDELHRDMQQDRQRKTQDIEHRKRRCLRATPYERSDGKRRRSGPNDSLFEGDDGSVEVSPPARPRRAANPPGRCGQRSTPEVRSLVQPDPPATLRLVVWIS